MNSVCPTMDLEHLWWIISRGSARLFMGLLGKNFLGSLLAIITVRLRDKKEKRKLSKSRSAITMCQKITKNRICKIYQNYLIYTQLCRWTYINPCLSFRFKTPEEQVLRYLGAGWSKCKVPVLFSLCIYMLGNISGILMICASIQS